jgi:chemotaxis protein methyltransferase CheR
MVRFSRVNLNDDTYPVTGLFDLVFCRNVLIYFDAATKVKVVARLLRKLQPHGYFFLGHAESLTGLVEDVESVAPNIYRPATGRGVKPRLDERGHRGGL